MQATHKLPLWAISFWHKATVFNDIPMRIVKDAAHVSSHRLTIIFNSCIKNCKFPDILKYVDITPVF